MLTILFWCQEDAKLIRGKFLNPSQFLMLLFVINACPSEVETSGFFRKSVMSNNILLKQIQVKGCSAKANI